MKLFYGEGGWIEKKPALTF